MDKALDFYKQALVIQRQVGDAKSEGSTLNNIGLIYFDLGEQLKALDFYDDALKIYRALGDLDGEARELNNAGNVYSVLGDRQKALGFYNDALPIYRSLGDRYGEAGALSNIGLVYSLLGENREALEYLNQSLPIRREVDDRRGEAISLTNIGRVYFALGENGKALNYCNQALPLATSVKDPILEANVSYVLMLVLKDSHPALGSFYGKLALNLLQQVRDSIQSLNEELKTSFLDSKNDYYHDLADLLIAQGRLPEAQQVLDLLKEQEYSDYVRGDQTSSRSPLTLTPAEKLAEDDYQRSTAQLVSLGEQWTQLNKISSRTPEQETQYQRISDQLDQASKGLNDYYARLYVLFRKDGDANKQVADVKGNVSLLRRTIARMPHTVALYTLVGRDRTIVIAITGSTAVARKFPISEKDLNQKVARFQEVLRDPTRDPRPLAQELYKILIGPVKADLNQAQALTLVWSLDGILRYVPMAALYDGKQYMVERYNTVTISPVSIPTLEEKPDVSNLSAAAMGISRKYEDGLPALPAVERELKDVVKDPNVHGANGVLTGKILLNGRFTEKAMEGQLRGQNGVVHIASHFVYKPGDDSQSYLLLAGKDEGGLSGYHLTVANFRDNQKLDLSDTALLTLSACETGMSGNASNGREVDGLGTTAQLKGAKAVISSLWEVNDTSTGQLMADFYQRWAGGDGKVTKVEALRQAQLDLLLGKIKPELGASERLVGFEAAKAPATFSHPYFWAPFVLMGNWK